MEEITPNENETPQISKFERGKENVVHISLRPQLAKQLRDLCERKGYAATQVIRTLIGDEWERQRERDITLNPKPRKEIERSY